MGWFRKKKEEQPITITAPETPPVCHHKWRDFDWYIETNWERYYNSSLGRFSAKIIEPYICCWCKERENHVLSKVSMDHVPHEELDKVISDWKTEYKDRIRGRAVIEDEIKDMQQAIDRQYLEIVAACYPEKLGLTEQQKQKLRLVHMGG